MSRKLINVQTLFMSSFSLYHLNKWTLHSNQPMVFSLVPQFLIILLLHCSMMTIFFFAWSILREGQSSVLGRNRSGHAFVIFFLHHRIFSSFFGSYSFYSLGKWFECLLGHFIGKWTIVMKLLNTHSVCCKVISKSKHSFVFLDFWNVSNWKS